MAATRVDTTVSTDDNLDAYYRDVAEHDLLSPERELALAKEIERREAACWALLMGYAPVARRLSAPLAARLAVPCPALAALDDALAAADPVRLGQAAVQLGEALAFHDGQRRLRQALERELGDRAINPVAEHFGALSLGGLDQAPPAELGTHREALREAEGRAAQAREAFITANLRLVVVIARRFRGRGLALADLVQEGNLGLMRAVDRFDYRRGFRFSTFAGWWIMAAVRRGILDKGRTVRLPAHLAQAQRKVAEVRRGLLHDLGRAPTAAEIASALAWTPARVEEVEAAILHQVSIDRPPDEDDAAPHLDLPDREDDSVPLAEQLDLATVKRDLERLVAGLSPVEADIIRRRYGMGDADEQTLQEIGEDYDRSRERIRQIEARALAKLRRALRREQVPMNDDPEP